MSDIQQITVFELNQLLTSEEPPVVLDVRTDAEVAIASLPAANHIPMNAITSRLSELDPGRNTVVMCHHGYRSMQVAVYLRQQGFDCVSNLTGGIDAWSNHIDPGVPRY